MSNKRLSELNELIAADVKSDDLFLVTDTLSTVLESKKIRASSLKSYILNNGSITGTVSNSINADTASYIDPLKVGLIQSSSYSISSSWSDKSFLSLYSNTASYIDAINVDGSVPSSSYSDTASYVNYSYNNGKVEYSQTTSYCENAQTSSFLFYTGIPNGTASYALSSGVFNFDGTASYLRYTGIPNGTASFALNITNPEITSSYLRLVAGRTNGSASYALTSSVSTSSSFASKSLQTNFLNYNGVYNGTSSYSIKSKYSDDSNNANNANFSNVSNLSYTSNKSDYAENSGTSSLSGTSSYCTLTASYALIAGTVSDPSLFRIYGPYNSNDVDGFSTDTKSWIQNFIIAPPTGTTTTVIIQAICDIKVPLNSSETPMSVDLYLDYTDGTIVSYGPIDTSRPQNYITSVSGAFSGYTRQSVTLNNEWPSVSGSWYRLRVEATGGATIDTTRGVKFLLYTKQNTIVTKTSYPPF
jgi:hypothetical protein